MRVEMWCKKVCFRGIVASLGYSLMSEYNKGNRNEKPELYSICLTFIQKLMIPASIFYFKILFHIKTRPKDTILSEVQLF